ncbi:MAG TPA: M56 family metallopeptidase [Candidatus Barnesiella excrementigallinarum]|nr:M56 family metallopeptidase [Candidatus Barnesiella excrementigallinarum]
MNFLLYLLQVHIALSLLYIAYKAISARNTHFGARRILLLSILLFALFYPLCRTLDMTTAIPSVLQFTLPEVQITPTHTPAGSSGQLSPYRLAAGLYIGITLLLILRMVIRLLSIGALRHRGEIHYHAGFRMVVCPDGTQPCSFFNWIFLPESVLSNPTSWYRILKHEYAHIRQMHSVDILLGESVAALCWINPFAWLLLKEIRLNLEYMADRAALRDEAEKKSYQYLLLDLAQGVRPHTSAIPFNHSFLKERIAMINSKSSSRLSLCRYLFVAPLFLLLIIGSQSCRQYSDREGENSHSTPSTTTESLPQTATVHEEPEQEPVFEVAEVMPVFPGGTQALLNTIAQKLKYPPKAIDDQIEGRVVLQFVVDKQGKVTDIQVLQGITPELNQAAIDVVRALPDWNPGMQDGEPVNVKYTLPIVFKLS